MAFRKRSERSIAGAVLGTNALDRTVQRVLDDIRDRSRSGLAEFTVTISSNEIGVRNRLDVALRVVVERVQDEGHTVAHVQLPDGSGQAFITVRPKAASVEPLVERPVAPSPMSSAAAAMEEVQSARDYVPATYDRLCEALRVRATMEEGPSPRAYEFARRGFTNLDHHRASVVARFQGLGDRGMFEAFMSHKLELLYLVCREADLLPPQWLAGVDAEYDVSFDVLRSVAIENYLACRDEPGFTVQPDVDRYFSSLPERP